MSIQVINNSNQLQATEPVAEKTETTQSAPESKAAPEQKEESTESGTEEKEAKEEGNEESSEGESDESDESKEDDSEKEKPRKKSGYQKKIDKLTARVASERLRAEELEQRLARLERSGEPKEKQVESRPAAADGKPNPDNFDTHAEYVEALTEWKTEQKLKERDQKAEQSRLQTEQERVLKTHQERVKAFAEKTADFNELISDLDDVRVSATVESLIVESEHGPELMYELAKNRKEFERINSLPPLAAAREIGRLETRLQASTTEKKPEPKKLTQAPKPIDPVGGGKGTVTKSLSDPSLSQAEYEEIRREQMKRRQAYW